MKDKILKSSFRELHRKEKNDMNELAQKIQTNGLDYTLVGEYYIPDLLPPEETRPI